jgi:hypothetical protein
VIPFVTPVLLLVALLVLLALREVWRRAPGGTAPGRVARVGSVIIAVIAVLVVGRLLVAPLPSARALNWKAGYEALAPGNVLELEVERPHCAPDGDAWIATPVVTYTPLAVFITVRMADTFNVPGCTGAPGYQDGRLPIVGGYLTGTYLAVQLAEPLMGRALFDGAGLLPEPRLPIP